MTDSVDKLFYMAAGAAAIYAWARLQKMQEDIGAITDLIEVQDEEEHVHLGGRFEIAVDDPEEATDDDDLEEPELRRVVPYRGFGFGR